MQTPGERAIAQPSRRAFIGALVGAVAAPMVIRPGLLMPVRAIVRPGDQALAEFFDAFGKTFADAFAESITIDLKFPFQLIPVRA